MSFHVCILTQCSKWAFCLYRWVSPYSGEPDLGVRKTWGWILIWSLVCDLGQVTQLMNLSFLFFKTRVLLSRKIREDWEGTLNSQYSGTLYWCLAKLLLQFHKSKYLDPTFYPWASSTDMLLFLFFPLKKLFILNSQNFGCFIRSFWQIWRTQ